MEKKNFVDSIKMLNLSLNKLKLIAKSRGIKGYKSMSKERLLSFLNESESVKGSEKNFDDARIEKIKNDFNELRQKYLRLEKIFIKQKTKQNLSTTKTKDIEKIFLN